MEPRFLLHSASSYKPLDENAAFALARSHALRLYRANAIYTFIPKNACSSLRVSLALYNGTIESPDDHDWIHYNNYAFSSDLADLATADYTFVILRCPYRRLVSVFMDKVVGREADALQLRGVSKGDVDLDTLTFTEFVKLLRPKRVRRSNIHWREQVDFLVYKTYDDYFSLEKFPECVRRLQERIHLEVVDARPLTKHGSDQYKILEERQDFSETTTLDLQRLKSEGHYPHPKSLFTEALVELASKIYADDIALYTQHFGNEDLLFG